MLKTARVEVSGWFNLVVTWSLQSRNGSQLKGDFVKHVLIRRFKQDKDGTWIGGEVVSENLDERIHVGLSPGFKFDTNCYIYTINVTLANGGTVNGRSEEQCYSMLSPSYVMLYLVILVAVLLVVMKLYYKPKKRKHRRKHRHGKRGRGKKKKKKKKDKKKSKSKGPSKPSSESGSVDEVKTSGTSGTPGTAGTPGTSGTPAMSGMSGVSGVPGTPDDFKKP
nr:unnamed protein product [Haemonchus contortus]